MTPEKKEALIYFVAGLLWSGVVALLVVSQLVIPDMKSRANSAHPYSESSLSLFLAMWFCILIWPSIIAGLQKDKRGKPWTWHKRARWFFWLSLVLSPIIWPFVFL